MPFFKYVARDRSGKMIEEVVETASQEDLVNILQNRNLFIISVQPDAQVKQIRKVQRRYHRGVKTFDLIMFSKELATLLNSGVTLIKSLDILCKQTESQTLLRVIDQVKKDVEGGYTFQNALKKHDKIFSSFLSLIHI